jgi:hypothetical protein
MRVSLPSKSRQFCHVRLGLQLGAEAERFNRLDASFNWAWVLPASVDRAMYISLN